MALQFNGASALLRYWRIRSRGPIVQSLVSGLLVVILVGMALAELFAILAVRDGDAPETRVERWVTGGVLFGLIIVIVGACYAVVDQVMEVMEVLTAYVREHSPWPPPTTIAAAAVVDPKLKRNRGLPTDIQAVMDVLGRRTRAYETRGAQLDLRGTDLRHLSLFHDGAHLERASLSGAHLEDAYLLDAHLDHAALLHAHLERAYLVGASLRGAFLFGAHIEGANLELADLGGADLEARIGTTRPDGRKASTTKRGRARSPGRRCRSNHVARRCTRPSPGPARALGEPSAHA